MKPVMHKLVFVLLLVFLPLRASHADIVVLVHGYLSNADTWRYSGVSATLHQAGWQYAGRLGFSPAGLVEQTITANPRDKRFYTLDLPSLAPASVQARWLQAAVIRISQKHPDEKITLVGHSAGGVVARLMLVQSGAGNINRLITIAAPHLGTDRAIAALDAVDSSGMFGMIKEWIVREKLGNGLYNTLRLSRGILFDLVPPAPGTFLFWLNAQPHPEIEYISIIRSGGYVIGGDRVVPPFSQDMNMVPALRGRSKSWITYQGHDLTPADGRLLVRILQNSPLSRQKN